MEIVYFLLLFISSKIVHGLVTRDCICYLLFLEDSFRGGLDADLFADIGVNV